MRSTHFPMAIGSPDFFSRARDLAILQLDHQSSTGPILHPHYVRSTKNGFPPSRSIAASPASRTCRR